MYGNVYAWLALLIPDYASVLVSPRYDLPIRSAMRDALRGLDLASLSPNDQDRVNEAIGYRVAAGFLVPVTTGGADGPLSSDGDGDKTRSYAVSSSERERWLVRASALLDIPSLGGGNGGAAPSVADAYPSCGLAFPVGSFGETRWPY